MIFTRQKSLVLFLPIILFALRYLYPIQTKQKNHPSKRDGEDTSRSLCHNDLESQVNCSFSANHCYEAPEPFGFLHDCCSDCNRMRMTHQSPDPLVAVTWGPNVNDSLLQVYRVFEPLQIQVEVDGDGPAEDMCRVDRSSKGEISIWAKQNCTIRMDWGVERAAWLELISHTHNALSKMMSSLSNEDGGSFQMQAAISEFNRPYPGKTMPLQRYGSHTYRLETNQDLYEGVRYTWLYISFPPYSPTPESNEELDADVQPRRMKHSKTNEPDEQIEVVSSISLVAKIKPVNYTGFFASSNSALTKAWYTGAYGVRLNMDAQYFNSILIERGDRVAIQGDGHPTMDAALVAFSPYQLVADVLHQTDSGNHTVVDQQIMAYPLYWATSAIHYYMASGDQDTFDRLVPDIAKILNARIQDCLQPDLDIGWMGWDDRLGNGWCFHGRNDRCPREAHLAFAGLAAMVCKDFYQSLHLANQQFLAQKYLGLYHRLGQMLVQVPEWPSKFGVHAAANAINSGFASSSEIESWMNTVLNDAVTICSFSQFNQYWILQALGNAGYMEHALASIQLCWSTPMAVDKECFWEQSSPDWKTFMQDGDVAPTMPSYCHPWSSGVTAWLSHVLGGIRPLQPGYKRYIAAPYLSQTYPSVAATINTPTGPIVVNATLREVKVDGTWRYSATLESPTHGYFGIPKSIVSASNPPMTQANGVQLNGKAATLLTASSVMKSESFFLPREHEENSSSNGMGVLGLSDEFQYIAIQKKGPVSIVATYLPTKSANGQKPEPQLSRYAPFPEPSYPAVIVGVDRSSGGDGLYKYGRDGYVLLGCHPNDNDNDNDNNNNNNNNSTDHDLSKLPNYIRNATVLQHGYPGWFQPPRELADEDAPKSTSKAYLPECIPGKRSLGRVGVDGIGGEQPDLNSILIHIEVEKGEADRKGSLQVSLYFVAKTKSDKFAIQVMDLESLNNIAPTTAVDDYEGGVWWTVQYDKSMRLRLLNMEGLHLSGVGFSRTTTVEVIHLE